MTQPFNWPHFQRPGIRYGTLTPEQLSRLPPFMQQHLSDRAGAATRLIADAGAPELIIREPVLPSAPSNVNQPTGTISPMLYASFNNIELTVGLADQIALLRAPGDSDRVYFFLVNTHPLQQMFLTFQIASTVTLGIPILNNFGFIEFNNVVPQDDVHLIANGAATTGVLVFANMSRVKPSVQ